MCPRWQLNYYGRLLCAWCCCAVLVFSGVSYSRGCFSWRSCCGPGILAFDIGMPELCALLWLTPALLQLHILGGISDSLTNWVLPPMWETWIGSLVSAGPRLDYYRHLGSESMDVGSVPCALYVCLKILKKINSSCLY